MADPVITRAQIVDSNGKPTREFIRYLGQQQGMTEGSLLSSNNLSDLLNVVTARNNLGLGSAATQDAGNFLAKTNNLSEIVDPVAARSNLGLGAAAVLALPIPINSGGTGSNTASGTRAALGLGSAALINTPISVTNGGTGAITAGAALTALGAAGVGVSNTFTATQTFNTSVAGSFGGWIAFPGGTPTISCNGSMTASSVSITYASYLRIGPLVYVDIVFSATLGGTSNTLVIATVPIACIGGTHYLKVSVNTPSVILAEATGYINAASSAINIGLINLPNYAAGAHSFGITGFYRCA